MKIPCLNLIFLKISPTTSIVKVLKFLVIIDHKTAIKFAIILKKSIFKYVNELFLPNQPNYPICIKLAARTLFKINKIEFLSKFLLFGLAHIQLFVHPCNINFLDMTHAFPTPTRCTVCQDEDI